MEILWQDVRYGVRMLRKNAGVTAIAALSLALGIGGTTAVFSLVNLVLLQGIPVRDPGSLVLVYGTDTNPAGGFTDLAYFPVSYPNFVDLRDDNDVFAGITAFSILPVNLAGEELPERIWGQIATGNYFEVLGVEAAVGRTFTPAEDRVPGAHPVVVLAHSLWRRRFGADPEAVGKTVTLNGHTFTIVGVTPPGFQGTNPLSGVELWVPMAMRREVFPANPIVEQRRWRLFDLVARLRPGVEPRQAEAVLAALGQRLAQEHPADNEGQGLTVQPLRQGGNDPNQRGTYARAGGLLLTAVAMVLLIACANVANLLLSRAVGRGREIALRLAQGATRGRLIRQLLTESVLLVLLGGALGLALASWLVRALWRIRPPSFAFADNTVDLGLDGRVLAFSLALSLLTGLVVGLAPALQAARSQMTSALKEGGAGAGSSAAVMATRNVLVVGQIALSLVALVGAGLFVESLRQAHGIDPGFETRRLLQMTIALNAQGYEPGRVRDYHRQVVERVESLPGVRGASLAVNRLIDRVGVALRTVVPEGQDATDPNAGLLTRTDLVAVGYLETAGIPLVEGRDFGDHDAPDAPAVAMVNQTLARRLWPGESAVGKGLQILGEEGRIEVVGVVRDSKYGLVTEAPETCLYLPLLQRPLPGITLLVRTAGAPEAVLQQVRREVQDLDRGVPLVEVETVAQSVEAGLWAPRAAASLLSLFGALALVLAAIGLYGVLAYAVRQRRREIGIRSALGAQRSDVLALVLRQAMKVVAAGLALGVAVAFAVTRLVEGFLVGTDASNPAVFAAVVLLLAAVALAASLIPARRASRIEPLTVLRSD